MHTINTNSRLEVWSAIDGLTESKNATPSEALALARQMKRPRIVVATTREEVWPEALEMLLSKMEAAGKKSADRWAQQNVLSTGEPSQI